MPVVDLRDARDFSANPYPYYAKMRAEGPVHEVRTDDLERIWMIVGYEEARAALADQRFSKDWRTTEHWSVSGNPINANMLETDPPHHTRLRKLVAREFTPGGSRHSARGWRRSPPVCWTRWSRPAVPISSTRSPSHCP